MPYRIFQSWIATHTGLLISQRPGMVISEICRFCNGIKNMGMIIVRHHRNQLCALPYFKIANGNSSMV
jgi:hypothetical protein